MENKSTISTIRETLGLIASLSTAMYLIILTLSISYNIGYLKQINPQIIDLLEIGDYLDTATHNVMFFLLGAIMFFIASLAFVKAKIGEQFVEVLSLGVFAFIVSAYFLLKGMKYSKYWPSFKENLIEGDSTLANFLVIILSVGAILLFIRLYRVALKIIRGEAFSVVSKGIMPIVVFLVLVLMPYLGGIIEGYVETKHLTRQDYNSIHPSDIRIASEDAVLKSVYIIKKFNKGVLIRQFSDNENSKFLFVTWPNIAFITYKNLKEPLSPL